MAFRNLLLLLAVGVVATMLTMLFAPFLVMVWGATRARRWIRGRRWTNKNDIGDDVLAAAAPLVVTIHGTGGRDAKWSLPGAPLHAEVEAAMRQKGETALWHCHIWSGDNSTDARSASISSLRTKLAGVFCAHPDRRVVLIGHSHGGNVAFKVAESFLDRDVRVVTLATPFLVAQGRPLGNVLLRTLPQINALAIGLLVAWGIEGFGSSLLGIATGPIAVIALLAVSLGGGIALLPSVLKRVAADEQAILDSTLSLETVDSLIARTRIYTRVGDEADGALKLSSLANSWVVNSMESATLFRVLDHFGEALAAIRNPDGVERIRAQALRVLQAFLSRGPVKGLYASNVIPAVTEMLAIWLGLLVLELLQLALGTRTQLIAATMNVTSSETPPGRWWHFQSLRSKEVTNVLLGHSQIYADPAILKDVAQWIATPKEDCGARN